MTPDPVPPLPSPDRTSMVTTLFAMAAAAPSTVPSELVAWAGAALSSRCTLGAVATAPFRPWSASATAPPPTAPPITAATPRPATPRSHGRPRGGCGPAGGNPPPAGIGGSPGGCGPGGAKPPAGGAGGSRGGNGG